MRIMAAFFGGGHRAIQYSPTVWAAWCVLRRHCCPCANFRRRSLTGRLSFLAWLIQVCALGLFRCIAQSGSASADSCRLAPCVVFEGLSSGHHVVSLSSFGALLSAFQCTRFPETVVPGCRGLAARSGHCVGRTGADIGGRQRPRPLFCFNRLNYPAE